MRIAICDDEVSQVEMLIKYVEEWINEEKLDFDVASYASADAFLFHWEDNPNTDILLLDIEMTGMNGMELAKKLRERKDNTQIIFVTGVTDYVYEGYLVDAISYLIKPVKKELLFECLNRAYEKVTKEEPFLLMEVAGAVRKVKLKEICYLESIGHDTYIHTTKEEIRCKKGINVMDNELKEYADSVVAEDYSFYRLHRSYLVNIAKIDSITKKEVLTEDGSRLPIPRGGWEDVNRAYLTFYRRKN